jgi:F-type H+-transporting ATPase subunit epsilon
MIDLHTAQTFNFELVSPERRLISEPAKMVTIPGTEGDFGVLAGHMPLIATIRPGVVEVIAANDPVPRRIFIAGGFADVNGTSCTVLAEEAVNVADLNRQEIEQAARDLREDLNMATDDLERRRIRRRLDLAQAKLEALTGHIQQEPQQQRPEGMGAS